MAKATLVGTNGVGGTEYKIDFFYCLWIDEDEWTPIPQQVSKAIDGTMVVETLNGYDSGRPITLRCEWESQENLNKLRALRDRAGENQTDMTLTLEDGRIFQVNFRHYDGPPLVVTPLIPRPDYNSPNSEVDIIVKLYQVG